MKDYSLKNRPGFDQHDKLPETTAPAKQTFKVVSLENRFRIARQNLVQLLVDKIIPGRSLKDEQAI
jgi:hypothetical protein